MKKRVEKEGQERGGKEEGMKGYLFVYDADWNFCPRLLSPRIQSISQLNFNF